jgi:predicted dehydrogenase
MGILGEGLLVSKHVNESSFVNGLEISAVCSLSDDVCAFAKKQNVLVADTYDELLKNCDAVYVISHPEKHYEYAKAVLPYGKPTYIDKTFAPDFNTAEAIYELGGAPFFSTSALRYATELEGFPGAENFTVTGGGSNFAEYSIHLVEMAVMLLNQPVKETEVKTVGNHKFCFITGTEGRTVTLVYAPGMAYSITALQNGKERQVPVKSDFFKGLMASIIAFFESGKPPVSREETLAVLRLRDRLLK